ncbi:MAG: hypothetical protein IJT04_06760 [Bacteroidales bacterium]|nr:hypothetical protein [Bacteroidales bacterium]
MENWIQNHKVLWWVLSVLGITAVLGTAEFLLCIEPIPHIIAIEYIGSALIAVLFNVILFNKNQILSSTFLRVGIWTLCAILVSTMSSAHNHFAEPIRVLFTSALICTLLDILLRKGIHKKTKK